MKVVEFIKKHLIIVIVAFVVLIAGIIVLFTINKSNESELKSLLKNIGIEFYEDFYYDQISASDTERATFLTKYKDIGIKINLDNLSRTNFENISSKIDKFVNNKTKKDCDKSNSKAVIYPKEPYGKKDYTVEVILDCGFKEKK